MTSSEVPLFENLEARTIEALGKWTVPSAAIGVFQDGHVSTDGFGVTNLETKTPVTPDTLFQIGSITKIFTTTMVMHLVDAGTLDLERPIIEYLPDLKLADTTAQGTLTLRHLLTHTSGLEGDHFDDYGMGDDALATAIANYHILPQISPPGELWSYCNTGFSLAGRILEMVTEQPYEIVMRERLFAPLGLERTCFFAHEAITHPIAVGHLQERTAERIGATRVSRTYALTRAVGPAGTIISTVGDLLRFAQIHLNGGELEGERILSPSSTRMMQDMQTPAANFAEHYGLGWALRRIGETRIIEHGGTTIGFQAGLQLLPDRDYAIAILTNSDRGHQAEPEIKTWALKQYRGLASKQPDVVPMKASRLDIFAGTYEQRLATITITREGDRLWPNAVSKDLEEGKDHPRPPVWLAPVSDREFLVVEGDGAGARIDFIFDEKQLPIRARTGGRISERTG